MNGALLEAFRHNTWATKHLLTFCGDLALEQPARTDDQARHWETFLSGDVDTERGLVVDDGALEVRQGVIVAQVLHHANAHREQVCSILTNLGTEPPNIQPWEYAEDTGRMWPAVRE